MFKFELRLADGDDAGSFETSASEGQVGDTLIADGSRRYRVTAELAPEWLAEFVDGDENGVLRVEPLRQRRNALARQAANDGTNLRPCAAAASGSPWMTCSVLSRRLELCLHRRTVFRRMYAAELPDALALIDPPSIPKHGVDDPTHGRSPPSLAGAFQRA